MDNNQANLDSVIKQKEQADKRLLWAEIIIGILGVILLFSCVIGAALIQEYLPEYEWLTWLLIGVGFVMFIPVMLIALKLQQVAGYYECGNCKHRYVPTYKQVVLALHMGRSRYMKCPNCNKVSLNKKVLSAKDDDKNS